MKINIITRSINSPHGQNLQDKAASNAQTFLDSTGDGRKILRYRRLQKIYCQDDFALSVLYIQKGEITLSVINESGKEAVVGLLGAGDFFGEACLAGQITRIESATSLTSTDILVIEKNEMTRMLRAERAFSDRFISYVLSRNLRMEQDLIDHLFNSSEKRLARTLLLLGRYGSESQPLKVLPRISQQTLAEMIGTTRARVNLFMNKFRRLGYIHYNGRIRIDSSLLSVVLRDASV
jgi:CRP/FNR family transcriptional regulator, cyclic AMP receptor protein